VLGFTLLLSLLSGVIFGLVGVATSRPDLTESLKEGGKELWRDGQQPDAQLSGSTEVALRSLGFFFFFLGLFG